MLERHYLYTYIWGGGDVWLNGSLSEYFIKISFMAIQQPTAQVNLKYCYADFTTCKYHGAAVITLIYSLLWTSRLLRICTWMVNMPRHYCMWVLEVLFKIQTITVANIRGGHKGIHLCYFQHKIVTSLSTEMTSSQHRANNRAHHQRCADNRAHHQCRADNRAYHQRHADNRAHHQRRADNRAPVAGCTSRWRTRSIPGWLCWNQKCWSDYDKQ